MTFGKFIKERRLEKGYGLREFCRKVKISPAYQSRVEKDIFVAPSAEKIIKMAEVLEGDADFFLAMGGKIHPETHEAIIATMGLWSHFIRKNPYVIMDYLEKARKNFNN